MQKYKDTHKHDSLRRIIGESDTELELRRSVIVVNNIAELYIRLFSPTNSTLNTLLVSDCYLLKCHLQDIEGEYLSETITIVSILGRGIIVNQKKKSYFDIRPSSSELLIC